MTSLKLITIAVLVAVVAGSPLPTQSGPKSPGNDGGFHFKSCGVFTRGLNNKNSNAFKAFEYIKSKNNWNSYDDILEIFLVVSKVQEYLLNGWISGLGTLYARLVIASVRIANCVSGQSSSPYNHLQYGSLAKICIDKNYGGKWGWKPYGSGYNSASDVISAYSLQNASDKFNQYLQTKGGIQSLNGNEKIIAQAILNISNLFNRQASEWSRADINVVFKSVTQVFASLANYVHKNLGKQVTQEFSRLGQLSFAKTYGLDFSDFGKINVGAYVQVGKNGFFGINSITDKLFQQELGSNSDLLGKSGRGNSSNDQIDKQNNSGKPGKNGKSGGGEGNTTKVNNSSAGQNYNGQNFGYKTTDSDNSDKNRGNQTGSSLSEVSCGNRVSNSNTSINNGNNAGRGGKSKEEGGNNETSNNFGSKNSSTILSLFQSGNVSGSQFDNSGPTESTSQSNGFSRAQSDNSGSTESTSESSGPSDAQSDNSGSTESTSESSGPSDAQSDNSGSTESTSESSGPSDAQSDNSGSTESTSESSGPSDAQSDNSGSTESTSESSGPSDAQSDNSGSTESTSESSGPSDAQSDNSGSTESTSESSGPSDAQSDNSGSTESTSESRYPFESFNSNSSSSNGSENSNSDSNNSNSNGNSSGNGSNLDKVTNKSSKSESCKCGRSDHEQIRYSNVSSAGREMHQTSGEQLISSSIDSEQSEESSSNNNKLRNADGSQSISQKSKELKYAENNSNVTEWQYVISADGSEYYKNSNVTKHNSSSSIMEEKSYNSTS